MTSFKKKNILFVVADITYVGGIERVVTTLANAFNKDLFSITILSIYNSNKFCNYNVDSDVRIDFLTQGNYSGTPGSFTRMCGLVNKIFLINRYFKNKEFDKIVSNSFPITTCIALATGEKKIISYEHVHYDYYSPVIRFIRKIVYKKVESIVCLTDSDRDKYSNWHEKVNKIYNPSWLVTKEESKRSYNRAIAVGRLEYQKGFDILIKLFKELDNKEITLDIYGVGGQKEYLEGIILENNIKNVFLRGKTHDIKSEYLKSDFLVMSSRYEGFGMVLVEAMECGLPCIAFNCPTGPSDIIVHNVNGFLVDQGDEKSFLEGISVLSLDYQHRAKLGSNAKISVEKFKVAHIIEKWEKLLS
ncbi:glycosyltransferase family 4 protein [Vibrio sp.]|uniref:glycosyltransferase family 4 protein n=1 Tax=Vibrio sp. TaxID=678 RepID=UPI00312040D1